MQRSTYVKGWAMIILFLPAVLLMGALGCIKLSSGWLHDHLDYYISRSWLFLKVRAWVYSAEPGA